MSQGRGAQLRLDRRVSPPTSAITPPQQGEGDVMAKAGGVAKIQTQNRREAASSPQPAARKLRSLGREMILRTQAASNLEWPADWATRRPKI